TTQVSVPYVSAFAAPAKKGGHDRDTKSHNERGTGAGGQNAQNSRSAGNFGDNHVGGGHSQSGSKNVGKW
ncbi:MAG: hypothetical protein ACDS79_15300, partial [Enterobacteriaceae bacterium]